MRKLSFLDKVIEELHSYSKFTKIILQPNRISPSHNIIDGQLSKEDKKHSAGLMRVNHTGEICAQGLYKGQASVAKSIKTQENLYLAANEEYDHLAWCNERLKELDARPSLLNIFWYWTSFGIGATAGSISDNLSYGFIIETENLVMKHLKSHLKDLPVKDNKSRKILKQMYIDESHHAIEAEKAGGIKLPKSIKIIMKLQSKVMTILAYKF